MLEALAHAQASRPVSAGLPVSSASNPSPARLHRAQDVLWHGSRRLRAQPQVHHRIRHALWRSHGSILLSRPILNRSVIWRGRVTAWSVQPATVWESSPYLRTGVFRCTLESSWTPLQWPRSAAAGAWGESSTSVPFSLGAGLRDERPDYHWESAHAVELLRCAHQSRGRSPAPQRHGGIAFQYLTGRSSMAFAA